MDQQSRDIEIDHSVPDYGDEPIKAPAKPLPKRFFISPDRKKEREEQILYNWIILALIIGIIVVIVTLIVSRPAPEYFSELYFTDHKALPRWMDMNQTYNFSYTIANHLAKQSNYTIITGYSLYRFNYSCESPAMYFDEVVLTQDAKGNITRRLAETTDPAAYIRDDTYSASFDYRQKTNTSAIFQKLTISMKGLDGAKKWSIMMDQTTGKAIYYRGGNIISETRLNLSNATKRTMLLSATKKSIILTADKKTVIEIKNLTDYTGGFLSFETVGSNVEIPWISLTKGNSKLPSLMKSKDPKCALLPIIQATSGSSAIVPKDKNLTLSGESGFDIPFDMAETSIALGTGEEIHFWSAMR